MPPGRRITQAMQHGATMPVEAAETLALTALTWVVGEADLRDRFLAMTGLQGSELRDHLGSPAFLAGLLDWLLAHEPTLLRFCAEAGIAPEDPARASRALHGGGAPGRPATGRKQGDRS